MSSVVHPAYAVARARELRSAGWSLRRVAEMIGAETGQQPTSMTIKRWTEPQWAAQDRANTRLRSRRLRSGSGRLGRSYISPEFKYARVVGLRATGMSCAAIAKAMTYDFSEPWTEDQVRYCLHSGRYSRRAA